MHIGIPLSPFGEKSPSGLGIFVQSLVHALIELNPNWKFTLVTKGHCDTQEFKKYSNVTIAEAPANLFWKDIACFIVKNIDVWIYVNPSLPLLVTPKRSIVTALDFANFYMEQDQNFSYQIKTIFLKKIQSWSLKRASRILCTSQATLNDMHKIFPGVKMHKSSVVMCGYTKISPVRSLIHIDNLPTDYFLIVGVIKPRKNQYTAVAAFFEAKKNNLSTKLVICGKGNGKYYEQLIDFVASSPYKNDVLFLGYRTNVELAFLYQNARALVFPSHVEGFGMPIVEAMSCGTPVICSENGALGEVGNGYAITVDSNDIEGFAKAMIDMQNEHVRSEFIFKGNKRAEDFSWEKTAQGYTNIIKNVMS